MHLWFVSHVFLRNATRNAARDVSLYSQCCLTVSIVGRHGILVEKAYSSAAQIQNGRKRRLMHCETKTSYSFVVQTRRQPHCYFLWIEIILLRLNLRRDIATHFVEFMTYNFFLLNTATWRQAMHRVCYIVNIVDGHGNLAEKAWLSVTQIQNGKANVRKKEKTTNARRHKP